MFKSYWYGTSTPKPDLSQESGWANKIDNCNYKDPRIRLCARYAVQLWNGVHKFSTGTVLSHLYDAAHLAHFFSLLLRDLFWFAFGGSNCAHFHPANCGMVFPFCLPQGLLSWQVGELGKGYKCFRSSLGFGKVPVTYLYWQSNP